MTLVGQSQPEAHRLIGPIAAPGQQTNIGERKGWVKKCDRLMHLLAWIDEMMMMMMMMMIMMMMMMMMICN